MTVKIESLTLCERNKTLLVYFSRYLSCEDLYHDRLSSYNFVLKEFSFICNVEKPLTHNIYYTYIIIGQKDIEKTIKSNWFIKYSDNWNFFFIFVCFSLKISLDDYETFSFQGYMVWSVFSFLTYIWSFCFIECPLLSL